MDFGPRSVHFEETRKGETKGFRSREEDRISTMAVICIKEERAGATLVPLVVIE